MSYHTHKINLKSHSTFLNEGRIDPVTKKKFSEGDSVVFCANCKSALLESSWNYLGNTHCEQSLSLATFPQKEKVRFTNRNSSYQKINNASPRTQSVQKNRRLSPVLIVLLIALSGLGGWFLNNQSSPETENRSISSVKPDYYSLDAEYISLDEVWALSDQELGILRNEIFARHGYQFKKAFYRNYFQQKEWYQQIQKNQAGSSINERTILNHLNGIEKANIQLLKNLEDAQWAEISDPDGFTNIRSGKSTNSRIVGKIYTGDRFRAIRKPGSRWYQVFTRNGTEGYMFHDRIRFVNN